MDSSDSKFLLKILKTGLALIVSLVVVISFFDSWVTITPGNVGVVFNRWTGSLKVVDQGMTLKLPWVTSVQSYPVALRTYTMVKKSGEGSAEDDSIDLPTQEGQHIRQDVSITYNTSPEKAAKVFQSFRGTDIEVIEATFVRRTAITVAQNISGQMNLQEVISSKRGELQNRIHEALSSELSKMGFVVDKINLGASHLPDSLEKQMQQKMAAQQSALQAEYKLQEETTLAKAKIAHAHGEAEANKLMQSSLTSQIIENKAIEKWNGVLPTVTGGNTVPFIHVNTSSKGSNSSN